MFGREENIYLEMVFKFHYVEANSEFKFYGSCLLFINFSKISHTAPKIMGSIVHQKSKLDRLFTFDVELEFSKIYYFLIIQHSL